LSQGARDSPPLCSEISKEEIALAEERENAIEIAKGTQTPAGAKQEKLLDEDVEKVAGGAGRNLITTDAGT